MNPVLNAFIYLVWFCATYYVVVFTLLLILGKDKLYDDRRKQFKKNTLISVLIPAFNEEEKIADTIKSLMNVSHKKIEFFIINDGSTDNTSKVVKESIKNDKRFKFIDNAVNKGKAACLNQGIKLSKGEFIATMDADSVVDNDIFEKTVPYFINKKVGAVTVSVEVSKPKNLLHRLIELEFMLGLSLFLKVATFFNTVFVTPGPFSIYRKSVLEEINGFDVDNITEDLEIAYRIHKHGYMIDNCAEAKVYTVIPPTFRQIYVQRRRWYSGAIQTLVKHRKMMFKRKYGFFSFMVPYNYLLTVFGLSVFFMSTYLIFKNLFNDLWALQYTGLNLLERIQHFNIDLLALGNVSIISLSSLAISLGLLLFGMKMAGKSIKSKKLSVIAFPLMFFLYQIWWIGSVISVIRGKKIKWR